MIGNKNILGFNFNQSTVLDAVDLKGPIGLNSTTSSANLHITGKDLKISTKSNLDLGRPFMAYNFIISNGF